MGIQTSKNKIPPEQLNELINNTHFDAKELKKWYNGFIRDCPTGALNQEQFVNLYNSFYECGNASKFAKHVFRTFDNNKDGTIGSYGLFYNISNVKKGT